MKNSGKEPSKLSSHNEYYDLGSFHRSVSTDSEVAQKWFDRGLIWTYAFNHEEAAHCFEKAISNDPECVMAYWGLAYSLGPNYNKSWDAFDNEDRTRSLERTHHAATQAKAKYSKARLVERALIDALQFRYPQETPAQDFGVWNLRYAKAM